MNLVLKFSYFNCQSNQAQADRYIPKRTFDSFNDMVMVSGSYSLETNGMKMLNNQDPKLSVYTSF